MRARREKFRLTAHSLRETAAKSAEELLRLGWEELAYDAGNCIVLEWPERVEGLPLEQAKRIALTLVTNTVHEINYHKN